MLPLFIGYDPREEAGTHAFVSSVIEHATIPVAITPLSMKSFGAFYREGQRDGTNQFIFTRFLIPYLCGYRGWAVFADGADMLMRDDIAGLWAYRDMWSAVRVVKHDYKTRHPRKYVGTQMEAANEDYPRKNWTSLMLINCAHFSWRDLTPEKVASMTGPQLQRLTFIPDDRIGALPPEWNWLADEYGANPDAKLVHWTAGTPAFENYQHAPHADEFRAQVARMNHVTP